MVFFLHIQCILINECDNDAHRPKPEEIGIYPNKIIEVVVVDLNGSAMYLKKAFQI